jgi:SOS response associated peptidase (SRAP)
MCGRARLSSDVSEIKLVFSIPPHRPTPNIAPSWNVAPTDPLPVVRYDARAGERSLDVMRWGLVPFLAKDIKVGFSNINAKAEGIEGKPAFREAFQRRRCLVPVDKLLRVEEDRGGEATLCDRARRPASDGPGRPLGDVAITGGREGAQLRDHHDDAKRAVRGAPQSDAGSPEAGRVASLARGGARSPAAVESDARALSVGRNDVLAGERTRGQRQEQ